jgi:hypothetical protein
LLVTGSPQFETQDDFGRGNGICALQQWQFPISIEDENQSLLDFDTLSLDPIVGNIANRLRSILHSPTTISATDLHDLTCFIIHRLLSLPPLASVDSPSSYTSECMRYAISAYMFIIHGPTYYSHLHVLNTLIIQLKFHLSLMLSLGGCQDSLLLWFLSVGVIASTGTNESRWFRIEARTVAEALGVQFWEDIEVHLRRILWLETRSRVLFQETLKEILASTSSPEQLLGLHEQPQNSPTRVA